MAWFIGRSVVVIALAFILGLVVGWLWWRRRKVYFGESQAIAKVTAKQQTRVDELTAQLARRDDELAAKDAEIVRLQDAAAAAPSAPVVAAPVAEVYDAQAHETETRTETGTETAVEAAVEADTEARVEGSDAGGDSSDGNGVGVSSGSATWSPAPATAGLVTAPSDPSPETLAALATPVEDIRTEDDHTPAVPEQGGAPAAQSFADADGAGDAAATAGPEGSAAEEATAATDEPVESDDLERVEGIGPRIGAALRGAGIHSFRQLADAETATLQGALEQAGLRFAPSLPTWSRQARLLADGDEAGFAALTQQLVGGRDVSGTK